MERTQQDPGRSISPVVISLLKGVIYQDKAPALWSLLLDRQVQVRDYVAVLGLELLIDEAEGYAFLRSARGEEEETLPRLVARQPLAFPVSLLLALLRKKLVELDAQGGQTRLILTRDEVVESIRIFLSEGSNEAKFVDQIDRHLNRIEELGFIDRLKGPGNRIEVRRILKAFVDAQWLSDFDARLAAYREHTRGGTDRGADHG
jgi:hypothetical protein